MTSHLYLCFVGLVSGLTFEISSGHLELQRGTADQPCDYNINIGTERWLTCRSPGFQVHGRWFSTADSSLKTVNVTSRQGSDKLGVFEATVTTFSADGVPIVATVRNYQGVNAIVFEQYFPEGASGTDVGNPNAIISAYPRFCVGCRSQETGYFSIGGMMLGETTLWIDRWTNDTVNLRDGIPGGPLALFNRSGTVLIISPFNEFMAASSYHDYPIGGAIGWGIMGRVNEIPAGYRLQTKVFHSDKGVNQAFEEWGTLMQFYYDTRRLIEDDIVINYLGYWTDNGSYYWYNTEEGMNYEDTLLAVKNYSDTMGIPYRYLQYDSWWYYKGIAEGVTRWEARPDVFPHGLKYIHDKTKLPVIAHNRWWSRWTTYAKEYGGNFNFVLDVLKSVPADEAFWDWLLARTKSWGLITYEQDWMNVQTLGLKEMMTNVTLGRDWLTQMSRAAQRQGMTVQYCMSNPRHGLQSLLLPAVTQARVSDDYHPSSGQWRVGLSSIFASALRLAPFKDTFWSTQKQPRSHSGVGLEELYPELQAVVSVLSTGPVGPGDGIGYSNASLIKRCCNKNGLILKPSRPATAIDSQIIERAFKDGSGVEGEVWSTRSDISRYQFGHILAVDVASASLTPSMAGLKQDLPQVAYTGYPPMGLKEIEFSDEHPLQVGGCTKKNFCLYHTTPLILFGSRAVKLYGEMDKFVPMSPQRITDIRVTSNDVTLRMVGVPNESVRFWLHVDNRTNSVTCKFADSGIATVSVASRTCSVHL